jgi:hypothetical protein
MDTASWPLKAEELELVAGDGACLCHELCGTKFSTTWIQFILGMVDVSHQTFDKTTRFKNIGQWLELFEEKNHELWPLEDCFYGWARPKKPARLAANRFSSLADVMDQRSGLCAYL